MKLDRCIQLHDLLHGPRLRAIVGPIRKLPGTPRIYSALRGIVNDENVTVSEVARLVGADPAIAARPPAFHAEIGAYLLGIWGPSREKGVGACRTAVQKCRLSF